MELTPGLLRPVLERSRQYGFLGPGPVEEHIDHGRAFLEPLAGRNRVVDLGSGGGVPGLVLAVMAEHLQLTLVDAMQKRCRFLRSAVAELGLDDRVDVACGRAEELARDPELRGRFDAVVSRSFGPPAVTAECGVGFLSGTGGLLLVSEPPDAVGTESRWPAGGLELLGLAPSAVVTTGSASIQILEAVRPCPEEFPRRVGVPAKRPLF